MGGNIFLQLVQRFQWHLGPNRGRVPSLISAARRCRGLGLCKSGPAAVGQDRACARASAFPRIDMQPRPRVTQLQLRTWRWRGGCLSSCLPLEWAHAVVLGCRGDGVARRSRLKGWCLECWCIQRQTTCHVPISGLRDFVGSGCSCGTLEVRCSRSST